ncbi:MAG: leucine-rich repeat protein [Treponema sp.]|nr:leucine-rich repeat protein [Treponema sp.]
MLISSCDSLTNPDAGKNKNQNQNQNQGQDDIPVVEVTLSELKTKIQNYQAGSYTIYKVKGSMSNSEFSELQDLIEDKSDNLWGDEYVGLDLSEVTGLTRIDYTWGFISLTIPSTVTEFGNYAQFDCVKILDGNPNFEYVDGVLYSADKTSLYFYPKEKTNKAFEIPSGVKRIQSAAFLWNNNIQSITIPESVEFIGMAALQTDSITQLTFKNKENWYNDENRLLSASDLENPASYREGKVRGICRDGLFKAETKTVTVSQLTEAINSYDGRNYITYKVTGSMSNNDYDQINQLIRNRGDQERWKGSRITLDLSGVTDLTTLSYVSWPIASVTVPKTFSGVEKSIAYTNIIVTADNPYYKYVDGSLYSADGTILYLYSSEKQDESFEIPSTVKRVWRFAFYNNTSIQNITIPESVVEIGWAAFDNDRSNLQTLTFKNKENWLIQNNNNNISKVNPADLEKVENYRWNNQTQTNGIFRNGIFKFEIKTVTVEQLKTELNSFDGQTVTAYKVTGSMPNNDYNQINNLMNNKGNNGNWRGSTISLDLSSVTDLTEISEVSWIISSLTIPATVSKFGEYSEIYKVIVTSDNPNFTYVNGSLYSPNGTILYSYSSEKTDESFEIPATVTKIWGNAFSGNYNIKSITIPASVVYIGRNAFNNSNIQALTFKNKENWMAYNNDRKVNPDDLEIVENYRWNNQTQTNGIFRNGLFKPVTKDVTVSQLTNEINSYAGDNYIIYKVSGSMSNDEYRTIANLINNKRRDWNWNNYVGLDLSAVTGLTKISSSWCLFSLTIPSSVSELSDSDGVDNIIIPSDNPNFKYVDGSLYSADETILYKYPDNKTIESFEIPSTVTKIWSEAFSMNSNIKSITIPANVVYIGWAAFDNSNIQTLTFKNKENWMGRNNNDTVSMINPEDLEKVENYRWNQDTQTNGKCRNGLFKPEIKTVTVAQLPDEINSYQAGTYTIYKIIGSMSNSEYSQVQSLIYNKSNYPWDIGLDLSEVKDLTRIDRTGGLMNLTLPSSVMEFGEYAQFRDVIILDDNPNFVYEDGVLYSKDKTSLYFYSTEKTETSFVIPSTVKNIWSASFCWNNNIKNITIPESAIFIGMAAFETNSIESLTFKDKQNWFISNNSNTGNRVNSIDLENPANYRWNQQLQRNGILREGIFKPETKTVKVSDLSKEINSYEAGTYTIYKVTGEMSNDVYKELLNLIYQNLENLNGISYIGFDLSEVTGLTYIHNSFPLFTLTIPDTVTDLGGDAYAKIIQISSNNSHFVYDDGILYSADKSILYYYPDTKTDNEFLIPNTVKIIRGRAFDSTVKQCIVIPESVMFIEPQALAYIQALRFVKEENYWAYDIESSDRSKPATSAELNNPNNYKWNGIFYKGLVKPTIENVTADQLSAKIDSYPIGTFTVYKVSGEMSNDDYYDIFWKLEDKRNGIWNWERYVGLDLSEVEGLTHVDFFGSLYCLIFPDSVQ